MSSAREEILARIRAAIDDTPQPPNIERSYRQESTLSAEELLKLLVDRLVDYKANVAVVPEAQAPNRITALLADTHSYVIPEGFNNDWLAKAMDDSEWTARQHR